MLYTVKKKQILEEMMEIKLPYMTMCIVEFLIDKAPLFEMGHSYQVRFENVGSIAVDKPRGDIQVFSVVDFNKHFVKTTNATCIIELEIDDNMTIKEGTSLAVSEGKDNDILIFTGQGIETVSVPADIFSEHFELDS